MTRREPEELKSDLVTPLAWSQGPDGEDCWKEPGGERGAEGNEERESASEREGRAQAAKTPKSVIGGLKKDEGAALKDTAVRKHLEDLNLDPQPGTPEQAAAMLNNDIKRWGDVIARAKIPKQ